METPANLKTATPVDAQGESVAVLVHGTFSGASENSGNRWWQSGSAVSRKLQSLIPGSVRVAEGGEVFHWSGENSERARSKAAISLLRHLRNLEHQGRDYHLVGHSHGGSVIWNAIQLSVLLKKPLSGLRSWTTIGTPFMQHRSRGALNVMNLMGLIVGLVLLLPAIRAPKLLFSTARNILFDIRTDIVLDPDHQLGYVGIFRAPVLAIIDWVGIAVDRRPDGIHIGSFDPNGPQSVAAYFFTTFEGLLLLTITIAMSYVFLHIATLCIRPALESYRIRLEQKLQRRTFDQYGSRWLGIWSPDDEAINGLRATLNLSISFVSKMLPRERVYFSDMFALLSRPYFWMLAPVYNRYVHPAVDGTVRNIVVRAAQGNDRSTATLVDVTASPLTDCVDAAPALPALLNVKLLAFANGHAHELVPKIRKLIAQTSFTCGLESFGGKLSGKELVHTAYFEQEEILRLIAANMAWDANRAGNSDGLQMMPPWLRRWFMKFKEGLGGYAIRSGDGDQSVQSVPAEIVQRKAG